MHCFTVLHVPFQVGLADLARRSLAPLAWRSVAPFGAWLLKRTGADPLVGADDALMRQAMQASGALSKREAVELGLSTLVRMQQQGEIRSYHGQMQWEADLEAQRLDVGPDPVGLADREQARL